MKPTSKDFENFGRAILKDWIEPNILANMTCHIDNRIMQIALSFGIVDRIKYDPEIHKRITLPVNKGDMIWWWEKP